MRILALALPLLFLGLAGCTEPEGGGTNAGSDSCDAVTRAGLTLDNATAPVVALATSKGCIVAELRQDKAPITVANFLAYTDEGFYSDLLIHRIIEDFMIQTGGMQADGTMKSPTHPAIKNEARSSGLKNEAYTLSMARTNAPDSATNQFFINHKANTVLDPTASSAGYAVFGTVVQGRDVVDAIAGVPVRHHDPSAGTKCQGPEQNPSCPIDEVHLFSIKRVV
jgi:peptidyl-prolyl cis-trans isomerase A (cyclophilin A)